MNFIKQKLIISLAIVMFALNINSQVKTRAEILSCIEENIATLSEAKKPLANDKIRVLGQVNIPTVFDYKKDVSVLFAYAMAGVGNDKAGKAIKVIKPTSTSEFEVKTLEIKDIFIGKSNLLLEGGESIAVLRNCQILKREPKNRLLPRFFPQIVPVYELRRVPANFTK